MKRIFTVIGARPQFVKAAAVSRRMSQEQNLQELLVHTGQHFDSNMSDVFFQELDIPAPAHHLGVAGGGHGEMTGRMLVALEQLFTAEKPDLVMVYGDTNSTLAGALAAAKLHIPVAHVEAGLRSFNKQMPEEINRILTDHCSQLLFTPTATATRNLLNEAVPESKIIECGDVMLDAALHFAERATLNGVGPGKFGLEPGKYILATVHRQENTDSLPCLTSIITGLSEVATKWPVILPLHPRTRARIESAKLGAQLEAIKIIEPIGYLDMVALEKDAAVIVTDSGGVQKEAFFHKVPCVTLRNETEWTELVEAGWNTLVSPGRASAVCDAVQQAYGTKGADISPYGSGDAADQIVSHLLKYAP